MIFLLNILKYKPHIPRSLALEKLIIIINCGYCEIVGLFQVKILAELQ